jgi:hypothetical protein
MDQKKRGVDYPRLAFGFSRAPGIRGELKFICQLSVLGDRVGSLGMIG